MVVGSDRVDEFEKILNQYNGVDTMVFMDLIT